MNKQKGMASLIALLVIVFLTIWYMVNILDEQYRSSKKSPQELESEDANITNSVQKTQSIKDKLENANKILNDDLESI